MKSNIILFLVFQAVAWALYFNWNNNDPGENVTSQKAFLVNEILDPDQEISSFNGENYRLFSSSPIL